MDDINQANVCDPGRCVNVASSARSPDEEYVYAGLVIRLARVHVRELVRLLRA